MTVKQKLNLDLTLFLLFIVISISSTNRIVNAADDVESEPFEPFAFELDETDVVDMPTTVNHQHALVGTSSSRSFDSATVSSVTTAFDAEFAKMEQEIEEKSDSSTSQEFQTEVEATNETVEQKTHVVSATEFPSSNDRKETTTSATKLTTLALPVGCEDANDSVTFVHFGRVSHRAIAKLHRKMESLEECARNCRDRMVPPDGAPFDCRGFSFGGRAHENSCDFYDAHIFDIMSSTSTERTDGNSISNYFERACLSIPSTCKGSAYSFDARPDHVLNGVGRPLDLQTVSSRKACLELCFSNPICRAVVHHRLNGTCELLEREGTTVGSTLVEKSGSDFYENACNREKLHCGNGQRIDFMVTRNVSLKGAGGLDVSVGSLSIRNCMRECVESMLINCRAFQYNPSTRECVLLETNGGDLSSQPTTGSHDLYEPICLNAAIDLPCSGDSAFERVPRTNLLTEDVVAHLKDVSLTVCVEACLFDAACRSFTYHRSERRCKILPLNRTHQQTRAVLETTVDLYELACDRGAVLRDKATESTTLTPLLSALFVTRRPTFKSIQSTPSVTTVSLTTHHACDLNQSVIVEKGRTLRLDYRNLHHVNVRELEKCEVLCSEASIKCSTFAFNRRTGDCLLSTSTVEKSGGLATFTQPNPSYDLYAFLGAACLYTSTIQSPFAVSRRSSTLPSEFQHTIGEFTATVFLATDNEASVDPFGDDHPNGITTSQPTIQTTTAGLTTTQSSSATAKLPPIRSPEPTAKQPIQQPSTTQSVETLIPVAPTTTVSAPTTMLVPRRDRSMERLDSGRVRVSAVCLERGVNVTFEIHEGNYSGAVYAAERFNHCREFVESKSKFSLFVTRPSVNTHCNALEEDGELTAVLVLSNDGVFPFDVTTKDDFYFQISCSYNRRDQNSLIRTGIVVGGPEPKSLMSGKKNEDKQNRVFLKIKKNGRPVTNVYIGEKLTAVVESDVDRKSKLYVLVTMISANRLRITDCNATRVGGLEPRPHSVQLIRDGCSLMPQIMTEMIRGPNGLEATFTAFRIDGSDQIDIACGLVICRHQCEEKETQCSQNRNKRDTDEPNDMITVDQRLRVLVDDPRIQTTEAPRQTQNLMSMVFGMDTAATEFCMNPTIFLVIVSLLLLCLVLLVVSITMHFCKRSSRFPYYSHSAELHNQIYIPRIER
ncbi:hypothetical protein M3Y94_01000900 [Aphelenchoides besseyi]|nr:hypothetical protein M3Y94_01000900 [Aphelenchoides besseyi]